MIRPRRFAASCLCCSVFICASPLAAAADPPAKPRVAVFPLGGTADADARDKVGFSLRTKLDRDGHFDPIDGPTMADLTAGKAIDAKTDPATLEPLAADESPAVLVWGQLDTATKGVTLTVNVLDTRAKDAKPSTVTKAIAEPTDLRFAAEDVLRTINGVGPFAHPVETAVTDDPAAAAAWARNPNLLTNGDFADGGTGWRALLRADVYAPPKSDAAPAVDKVVVLHGTGAEPTAALAMNLSKDVAESNGLACLSGPVTIKPATRYRLQYRYRSDGPSLHVFVKGYVKGKDIGGQEADVECYRCQVPPSGGTGGKWRTVVCDVNPQSPGVVPAFLKVDLYAYLTPGEVRFADVQLKAVGAMTRVAKDDAIKPGAADKSTTRP